MSSQLTPDVTITAAATIRTTSDDRSSVATRPSFSALRRVMIRGQAAHTTRGMLRELVAIPQTSAPAKPPFVRLDALCKRYAELGGDPADLLR